MFLWLLLCSDVLSIVLCRYRYIYIDVKDFYTFVLKCRFPVMINSCSGTS